MDLDRLLQPTLERGAAWSVQVRRAGGDVLAQHDPERLLRTASVGKLYLLLRLAELIESGALDPADVLDRSSGPAVADSGLWQHLDAPRLTVADAARLVGAVSDNWATNVLLARVGIDTLPVGERGSRLHDYVRDERGPGGGGAPAPPAPPPPAARGLRGRPRRPVPRAPGREPGPRLGLAGRRPVDGRVGVRARPAGTPGA